MNDKTPTRPLPGTDEADTSEFWRKTRDKVLGYQHCDDCGTIVFYPRRHCTGCLGSNLSWQARTGYIAVGPSEFHSYVAWGYTEFDLHEIGISSAGSSCVAGDYKKMLANLQLPHGAKLTNMTLYWKDASADDNTKLELARSDLAGSWALVTIINTSGSAGSATSTTMSVPSGYATVDNSQYSYALRLWLYCETWVYGVVFEYEYTEPY